MSDNLAVAAGTVAPERRNLAAAAGRRDKTGTPAEAAGGAVRSDGFDHWDSRLRGHATPGEKKKRKLR